MSTLKERIRALRDCLLDGLIERETPVRLALLAALSGEHLLLIGPPGTAKSELARRLRWVFRDASYFERLLTRFSVPEELFGPLSIKALEEDRYERQTAGYLPSASVAFIDEIFKANSAILNALLTLLNEREFDNGHQRLRTPLICVIGASNELPDGDELSALYDRFLLRYQVPSVSDEGFERLLALRGEARPQPPLELRLSARELEEVRRDATRVRVPEEVMALLKALRAFAAEQEITVSDRRWRKIVQLLQVAAYTDDRAEVSIWDCWLLQHCACEEPEERQQILDWFQDRLGTTAAADPERLTKLVTTWEGILETEKNSQSQRRSKNNKLLYQGADGKPTEAPEGQWHKQNASGEKLYLYPENYQSRDNHGLGYTEDQLQGRIHGDIRSYIKDPKSWLTYKAKHPPLLEPTRYSAAHVQGRLQEVDKVARQVTAHLNQVDRELASLQETVDGHLWISPGFSQPASTGLGAHRDQVRKLDQRLKALRQGIEKLPRLEEP